MLNDDDSNYIFFFFFFIIVFFFFILAMFHHPRSPVRVLSRRVGLKDSSVEPAAPAFGLL
jgi:hypothetical protein